MQLDPERAGTGQARRMQCARQNDAIRTLLLHGQQTRNDAMPQRRAEISEPKSIFPVRAARKDEALVVAAWYFAHDSRGWAECQSLT